MILSNRWRIEKRKKRARLILVGVKAGIDEGSKVKRNG